MPRVFSTKKRLQVKINAVLIPLILFILGIYIAFDYLSTKNKLEGELKTSSSIVAARLAHSLIEPFWSLDDGILHETIKSEMMDQKVLAVKLFDRQDNKIYVAFGRDQAWQIIEGRLPDLGKTFAASMPILRNNDKIGRIEVYVTKKFANEAIRKSMANISIATLVLIVTVSLTTNLVLRRIVISPISRLTKLANEISVGNLDIHIEKESDDEIGALSDAFERMRYSLMLAIKKIKQS